MQVVQLLSPEAGGDVVHAAVGQDVVEALVGGGRLQGSELAQLFEDRFRRPLPGDKVQLLSPTELLQELKLDAKNRSNSTVLGTYLKRNHYEQGEGRERRRYKVALTKDE